MAAMIKNVDKRFNSICEILHDEDDLNIALNSNILSHIKSCPKGSSFFVFIFFALYFPNFQAWP